MPPTPSTTLAGKRFKVSADHRGGKRLTAPDCSVAVRSSPARSLVQINDPIALRRASLEASIAVIEPGIG